MPLEYHGPQKAKITLCLRFQHQGLIALRFRFFFSFAPKALFVIFVSALAKFAIASIFFAHFFAVFFDPLTASSSWFMNEKRARPVFSINNAYSRRRLPKVKCQACVSRSPRTATFGLRLVARPRSERFNGSFGKAVKEKPLSVAKSLCAGCVRCCYCTRATAPSLPSVPLTLSYKDISAITAIQWIAGKVAVRLRLCAVKTTIVSICKQLSDDRLTLRCRSTIVSINFLHVEK